MKTLTPLFLTSVIATSLIGCGGDSGGSSSGGSVATVSETSFNEISVPNNFEWRGVNSHDLAVNIVSSYSQKNGNASPIRGAHIVKFYSITSDGIDATPFYSGITNKEGVLNNEFSIPAHWESIKIVASVRKQNCESQFSLNELEASLSVACDIMLDAD